MKLAVTIDVEEEGLFSGNYDLQGSSVKNVTNLRALAPIFMDLGIRPTLLVSYQVARDKGHHEFLAQLRENWGAEIGAHLHTWNTPPFEPSPHAMPVPSELISTEILKAKFLTLLDSLNIMGINPVSFRMGRFNMGPKMFSVLEQSCIRVDSSIAPMRRYYGGPDHLTAMTDPYFPDPQALLSEGTSHILEVPVTILPIFPGLGVMLERLAGSNILPGRWVSWFAQYLGSIPSQPMLTGLGRLKTAVRLHSIRKGEVITVFFHSSELLPGGCPQHPTFGHVELFLEKLRRFLTWLITEIKVESLTLSEIYGLYHQQNLLTRKTNDETP